MNIEERRERIAGVLLGTALGDALGLPAEGLSPSKIRRRFGRIDRFRLIGPWGFVSDDTEQSALVAQSLIRHPGDPVACARAFRWSLLGWFLRLPFGIGKATILACFKVALGFRTTGVSSAGNGSAMRAAVLGAYLPDPEHDPLRRKFGRALAEVTHLDERAISGALYVAELTALCAREDRRNPSLAVELVDRARRVVESPELGLAIDRARNLAIAGAGIEVDLAIQTCGNTGYVVHTLALATFAFVRFADDLTPRDFLAEVIAMGGDTDTRAAIAGAWIGARRGASALPASLLDRIQDGPFGPSHLKRLAEVLSQEGPQNEAISQPAPRYSATAALVRNLALMPVILAHGFGRFFYWLGADR